MSKDKTTPENESVKQNQAENIEQATAQNEKSTQEEGPILTEVEQLEAALATEKERYMRLFAEFENYKRRTSKERIDMFKSAGKEVMTAMLPVLDDFDRAIVEIKKTADNDLLEGVELINSKLRDTLEKQGLEEMSVKAGDKFDADLHDAVTQIPAPDKKLKGKIVDVIQKGYILGEKIIRYPKVVTGK